VADGITFTLNTSGLQALIDRYGAAATEELDAACLQTADAVVREARARLDRQLGPNATGATLEGIHHEPIHGGYVVLDTREPFPDLPGWIEHGTKRGKPHSHTERARPYFYVSEQLEAGAHFRRLEEALQNAADKATR
jgi:hypothetical protein